MQTADIDLDTNGSRFKRHGRNFHEERDMRGGRIYKILQPFALPALLNLLDKCIEVYADFIDSLDMVALLKIFFGAGESN